MHLMTEGLRALAGATLRRFLSRFTSSPLSGAATGTVATALIQSSSATTVMVVGFVGAGLLSFPQALGVIFGANLGTTVTGWMVALLGFKFKLAMWVMPLILLGALAQLFATGRSRAIGLAAAGFGLIFAGIAALQSSLSGLEDVIQPSAFPPDTWLGRFGLVWIGIGITLVTQSSSAGVAMALTAVHAGSVTLAQGSAMVIGMNIGTTTTVLLATFGGSTAAKRAGYAHVVYNVLTAVAAFALLDLYTGAWRLWNPDFMQANPESVLAGFHTAFNGLGVLIFVPLAQPFARLIERLVPQKHDPLTESLDPTLLEDPPTAMAAASYSLRRIVAAAGRRLRYLIDPAHTAPAEASDLPAALDAIRTYADRIQPAREGKRSTESLIQLMHAIDHVDRLIDRCGQTDRAQTVRSHEPLASVAERLRELLEQFKPWFDGQTPENLEENALALWQQMEIERENYRQTVFKEAVADTITREKAYGRLEAYRWLRRISYHLWRLLHHLNRLQSPRSVESDLLEEAGDAELD